ncbi:hypothetical protein [Thermogymnomonas acidicola]|uniref:hypothetical protein n=1 Tax=Thermogymnomonas acidicola TaxID=399579 RepID=UPI000946879C|nr:hypothetical protein [Thermogymnomonas acidicola]
MVRLTSDEKKYIAFIVIFATILLVTSYHSLFLLAPPPFAVSTYLLTFDHGGRFSTYSSISASYLFVILTTEAIHVLLGTGTLQMLLNVVLVSLFITFLPYRHPPCAGTHNLFLYHAQHLRLHAELHHCAADPPRLTLHTGPY